MSRYLAIDVDAGGLFVVSGQARRGALALEQVLSVPVDADKPLSLNTAAVLGQRLKAALQEAKVAAAPVLICVARDRIIFKDVKHPKTELSEEPAIVRFQAQRDLAVPPESLIMDYVPVPTAPELDEKKASAVFLRKDLFDAAKLMCESAGLKLVGMHPRPFATASGIHQAIDANLVAPPEPATAAVATLTIWDGGGEFVVSHDEQVLFSRSVGANALSSEAAFLGEVKRSLAASASAQPKAPVAVVYLAEGQTTGGSWLARLQQAITIPVQAYNPLGNLALSSESGGRYAAAVGLLAARAITLKPPLNFVTPRQPKTETKSSTRWMMIAGFLLLLVCGAGALALYFMNSELEAKLARALLQSKSTEADIAKAQLDANRLKAIRDFQARSVSWLDVFYDTTDAVPNVDKIRIKEFDANLTPVTVQKSGGAIMPGASRQETVWKNRIELKVVSTDDQYIQDLYSLYINEKQNYANTNISMALLAGMRMGEGKEATITAEVLPRKPSDYTRVLKAVFPKQPPPVIPKNQVIDEEDTQ